MAGMFLFFSRFLRVAIRRRREGEAHEVAAFWKIEIVDHIHEQEDRVRFVGSGPFSIAGFHIESFRVRIALSIVA